MPSNAPGSIAERRAEAVRNACIEAGLAAWEDAGISGLCPEGRWEMAIQAMRELDLSPLLQPPRDDP